MHDKRLDHLRKSSLPLEHGVAALAVSLGYFVRGEFPYTRINENGARVEFSVDVHLELWVGSADAKVTKKLHVLVECKYASPGVAWVFSHLPENQPFQISSLCSNWWADEFVLTGHGDFENLEPPLYGTRGVSLSDSSADPSAIRHGVSQLRFAVPMLIANTFILKQGDHQEVEVSAFSTLLTTTAPVLLLRPGATPDAQGNWQSLDSSAMPCEHLGIYQQSGPDLYAQCEAAASLIKRVAPQSLATRLPDLPAALLECTEVVHVVPVSQLQTRLEKLKEAFISMPVEHQTKLLSPFAPQQ